MTVLKKVHERFVFNRRVVVLARHLAKQMPVGARVLDVGCGSGDIAAAIMAQRPDIHIEGVDVLVRSETRITVRSYDGHTLPYEDDTFDLGMIIDVLHHTDDPASVLAEVQRVARQSVLIKDHFRNGLLARPTLRFMDWIGNAPHGVRLPYNYLSRAEWAVIWRDLHLSPVEINDHLSIYPRPFSWLFDRGLHFISLLKKAATDTRGALPLSETPMGS